ncbi:MAG: hypothetical protein AVDCRST_MAG37-1634, partial [uncultured Rubrobacteraceae bacterium]
GEGSSRRRGEARTRGGRGASGGANARTPQGTPGGASPKQGTREDSCL